MRECSLRASNGGYKTHCGGILDTIPRFYYDTRNGIIKTSEVRCDVDLLSLLSVVGARIVLRDEKIEYPVLFDYRIVFPLGTYKRLVDFLYLTTGQNKHVKEFSDRKVSLLHFLDYVGRALRSGSTSLLYSDAQRGPITFRPYVYAVEMSKDIELVYAALSSKRSTLQDY